MSLGREFLALVLTGVFALVLFTSTAKGFGKGYSSYFDYHIEGLMQINVEL